jgi:hypothetical protein
MPAHPKGRRASALDSAELRDAIDRALTVDSMFFTGPSAGKRPHTDLIANLFDAATHASGKTNARVILLSDMLQSTPTLNFEPPRPVPGLEWIERAKARRVIPNLKGVCVFAIGGVVSNDHGVLVRDFWERYVAAAGGSLKQYSRTIPDVSVLGC